MADSEGSFHCAHRWDSPFTLNLRVCPCGRAPAPPHSSLRPRRHSFRRRSTAPQPQPLRATPPRPDKVLTRREAGDPRNLVGDLCSEHREVLLVAFEVGRHGGPRVIGPGWSLGRGTDHGGQRNTVLRNPGTRPREQAENWDSSRPGRFLIVRRSLGPPDIGLYAIFIFRSGFKKKFAKEKLYC